MSVVFTIITPIQGIWRILIRWTTWCANISFFGVLQMYYPLAGVFPVDIQNLRARQGKRPDAGV